MYRDRYYWISDPGPQLFSWSAECDPTKWGTPDRLKDPDQWYIKGSFCDLAQEYAKSSTWEPASIYPPGTIFRAPNRFPYTKLRTRPMKGDFYNSSTHGRIRLSVKGRQLLAANRDAAQGAIQDGDFNAGGQALSRSRAELAKYMGELESNQQGTAPARPAGYGAGPTRMQALQDDLNRTTYNRLVFDDFYKETPVTDQKNQEPVEKSRSRLLGEATHELVQAQRELEYIQKDAGTAPDSVYIGGNNVGSYMRGAVADLVTEQWGALSKKALTRAKARVAKAEKAVAALLAE